MIKFLDLHKINSRFSSEFNTKLTEAIENSSFVLGEAVTEFEAQFASYCGTKHCIGVASGLDALTLILKAYIHLGKLQKGDQIILPANTFYATIVSVLQAGLKPVLVDPNEVSFNITASIIEKHLSSEVKAIIVVHLYGRLVEMEAIKSLAKKNNLLVIEDAAQAHGAESKKTLKAGNLADAAAFSFYPSKNLGALGDAGAVTTNNTELAAVLQRLRNYGASKHYVFDDIGMNSRLDAIQASFLSIKLKVLDADNTVRRKIAEKYLEKMSNPKILLPSYDKSKNHVFYVFIVRVENRLGFIEHMKAKDIETHIHYPIPPHKQNALKQFNHINLPITKAIHNTVVSLPISPVMTDSEVDSVIEAVNTY